MFKICVTTIYFALTNYITHTAVRCKFNSSIKKEEEFISGRAVINVRRDIKEPQMLLGQGP